MASPGGDDPVDIVVIVAGLPRKGKSTVLNNLFKADFVAKTSALSVTKEVSSVSVKRNGVTVEIFDTPGLGSADLKNEDKVFLKDMKSAVKGTNFILLYCLSISDSSNLTEAEAKTLKTLHSSIGKYIWEKCVLLLTFSDQAIESLPPDLDYVEYVRQHTSVFQGALKKYGGKKIPDVKCIFDYPTLESQITRGNCHDIVAIPVRRRNEKSHEILPNIKLEGLEWTDIVLCEILTKSGAKERALSMTFMHGERLTDWEKSTALVHSTSPAAMMAQKFIGFKIGRYGERALESVETSMLKLLSVLRSIASKRKKT